MVYEVWRDTGLNRKEKVREFTSGNDADLYASHLKAQMLKKSVWQRAVRQHPGLKLVWVRHRSDAWDKGNRR